MKVSYAERGMVLVAGVWLACHGLAAAAEATLSSDVASAYVFRGSTLNDGLVWQPGLEVAGLPVDLGIWGNLDIDDYSGALRSGQFSEIDLYGSYTLPVDCMDVSVGYTEYLYPGAGGDPLVSEAPDGSMTAEGSQGEADREVSLGVGLHMPLEPALTVYYGLDGAIKKSVYIEFELGRSFDLYKGAALELGATLGYLASDSGPDGFSHVALKAAIARGPISAGITYIGQMDSDVLPDVKDGGSYDVDVVGTVGITKTF